MQTIFLTTWEKLWKLGKSLIWAIHKASLMIVQKLKHNLIQQDYDCHKYNPQNIAVSIYTYYDNGILFCKCKLEYIHTFNIKLIIVAEIDLSALLKILRLVIAQKIILTGNFSVELESVIHFSFKHIVKWQIHRKPSRDWISYVVLTAI